MASRKYIKFGLRADKNLADLNNPTTAINNVLDDLASGNNVLGEKFSFSSGDILPLRSLMSTDIKDTVDPITQLPKIFTDLEGSVDEYNADIVAGSLVSGSQIIQPQITLQDRLSRHKIVLGDPPFVGGGPGPVIDFVSSDRITRFCGDINNFTINLKPLLNPNFDIKVGNRYKILTKGSDISDADWDLISGQSLAGGTGYSDGDYFTCIRTVEDVKSGFDTDAVVRDVSTPTANFADDVLSIRQDSLQSDQLFTKIKSSAVGDIIRENNAWRIFDDSENLYQDLFNFGFTLHPAFRNDRGLLHINGYLGGAYDQIITTNGLLIVEEDPDESNNWNFIAGTNTDRIEPNYSTELGTTSVNFPDGSGGSVATDVTTVRFNSMEDYRKLALGMRYTVLHTQSEPDPDPGNNNYNDIEYEQSGTIIRKDVTDDGYEIVLDTDLQIIFREDIDPTNSIPDGEFVEENLLNFYTGTPVSQELFASFTIGQDDLLEYKEISFSVPRGDERVRVRYTVWWPEGDEVLQDTDKIFNVYSRQASNYRGLESSSNRALLGVVLYPEQIDQEFLSQRFSYTYFRDNKASILKQRGKTKIEVDSKFVNVYQRDTSDTIVTESSHAFTHRDTGYTGADSKIERKIVKIGARGLVIAKTRRVVTRLNSRTGETYTQEYDDRKDTLVDAEVGDHIVFSTVAQNGDRKYFSYQIMDLSDVKEHYYTTTGWGPYRERATVDVDIQTTTGITGNINTPGSAGVNNEVSVVIVKNKGLVGIFKHGASGLSSLDNPFSGLSDGAQATRVSEVQPDNIVYKIEPDSFDDSNTSGTVFDTHRYGFRVASVGHDNDRFVNSSTIGVEHHPNAPTGEQAISTTEGIAVVYASRGLEDNSTVEECTDVFGKEVSVNAPAGTNVIVLRNVDGVAPGQFVYFDGIIPYDSNNMTVVRSVNTSSNTIELEGVSDQADVFLTDLLPIGVTVVFVPTTAPQNGWNKQNKEYCIVPLNTAPPWEGTNSGLASPALNADKGFGVMAKELRFVELSFVMPEANIKPYDEPEQPTYRSKYLPVNYVPPVSE